MTGHRIVCEGIRTFSMIVMAIDVVEQTADMLAQRVIQNQERVRFWTAHCFCLLEQILDATVIDAVVEPRRCGEETREVGFVRTLQYTAGDVGQTFVVQDDQTGQVILEMVKLAPILKEIAKNVRVGGHNGSGSDDGKLHETFALPSRGWSGA
jgi:3-hydroxyacyl-CoA dehydrogenase